MIVAASVLIVAGCGGMAENPREGDSATPGSEDTRASVLPEVNHNLDSSQADASGAPDANAGGSSDSADLGAGDYPDDGAGGTADRNPDHALDSAAAGEDGGSPGGAIDSGEGLDGSAPMMLGLVAGSMGGPGYRDGTGKSARFSSPVGVASDGAGNLFVADKGNNTIRKISVATGAVTTLAGAAVIPGAIDAGSAASIDGVGATARFSRLAGIATDGMGNLFVVDNDAIRKVVVATGAVTTIAGNAGGIGTMDGIGTAARFYDPSGIASDGAGNLFVADTSNCTLRKLVLATGAVTTLAGSAGSCGHTDGTGGWAQFDAPVDVASDGAGNLFVADYDNTIRKIVVATAVVSTLAGMPGNHSAADGSGTSAYFAGLRAITSDRAGNLFVMDVATIRQVVVATAAVTTVAGPPQPTYIGGDYADGTGTGVRFNRPLGLASNGTGSIFIADTDNHVIRQMVVATTAVTTLAGAPAAIGSTDGPGEAAQFNYPVGLASDGWGNLFVADKLNRKIRQIVLGTGAVYTFAGTGSCGAADGTRSLAQFSAPEGVASDGAGNLFIADPYGRRIRRIAETTGEVSTLFDGSAGIPCPSDLGAAVGLFDGPGGVASDGAGNLFFADTSKHTIQRIVVATGAVTTLAGSAQVHGSADGVADTARFYSPWGVASDGAGSLFIADTLNNTIRRIVVATGAVTTLAGSAGTVGATDGAGAAALFNHPTGVASDGAGSLFIADTYNCTVRKIAVATGVVSTVIGSPGHCGIILGPLPAQLGYPRGVAFLPPAELFITNAGLESDMWKGESAVLVAHF